VLSPCPPQRAALGSYQDQIPTNKVSTLSGDCHTTHGHYIAVS